MLDFDSHTPSVKKTAKILFHILMQHTWRSTGGYRHHLCEGVHACDVCMLRCPDMIMWKTGYYYIVLIAVWLKDP